MKNLFYLSIIFLLFSVSHVSAQEEKFISLFVFNFAKNIEWPDDNTDNFTIDVIGHPSVYEELKKATENKMLGTKPVRVRNFQEVKDLSSCHILFIGHWKSRHFDEILEKYKNSKTLIITEKEGLIEAGSAINFIIRENGIKYEVKISNATRNGLKVGGKVRELAYAVYD